MSDIRRSGSSLSDQGNRNEQSDIQGDRSDLLTSIGHLRIPSTEFEDDRGIAHPVATDRIGFAVAPIPGLDFSRRSFSDLSLNEKLAGMMKFQRAYEAAVRVISIMESTLEAVIDRMDGGN